MRRSPWLMMMLAALLVWWAARVVPAALGLASAAVNVGGSLQVTANTSTAFVTCTAPAAFTGNIIRGAAPRSVTVTCYNNTNVSLSVVLNMSTPTPTPTRATMPLTGWTNSLPVVKNVTITVPASGTKTQPLYAYAANNASTGGYTQTYTSATSVGNGLDYFKSLTVNFTVQ